LKLPPVLLDSEYQPTAVFALPEVMLKRAWSPSAVFNEPPTLPGSGVACTPWQSAKQTSADRSAANMMFRFFMI
jgi:hypothetical protein